MPEQEIRTQTQPMDVSQLLFDDLNFRLPEYVLSLDQKGLIEILDRDFDPLTIARSLVDNGYFAEEPLVVIPKSANKYIVVEGNRRLAALKLLLKKELRPLAQDPQAWEELAKSPVVADLSTVPVVIYKNRDEARMVLGFRHIAGILKWGPLAKARFITNLVEQRGKKADFRQIGRQVGHRADTVRKYYIAYRAYLQAKDDFEIDTSKLEKNFAVFYRAITGSRQIAQFITLSKEQSPGRLRKPVPLDKAAALEELIEYIHGTEATKPVITDSRQLSDLGEVLASKSARADLRATRDLLHAWYLTEGEIRRLLENLTLASYYLDEALKDAHREKDDVEVKAKVRRCAQTMSSIARDFPQARRDLEDSP